MKGATISLAALAFTSMAATASAALTPVSGLAASTNGYDDREEGWGCAPNGCLSSNAIDGSLEYASRWSCIRYKVDGYEYWDDDNPMCELTLDLPTLTDIEEVRIALWKGNKRTRSFNIIVDGTVEGSFTSSGTTENYEAYELNAKQASQVTLQAHHTREDNGWFRVLEIQLMTEFDVVTSTPEDPTDPACIGCYDDMIRDRVMVNVITIAGLTPEMAINGANISSNDCVKNSDASSFVPRESVGAPGANSQILKPRQASTGMAQASASCGGDMAFSLYQSRSCVATPAPTPSISDSGCPDGSIESSLEITLSYEGEDRDLDLYVEEPSRTQVWEGGVGDVGFISTFGRFYDPGMKYSTYALMNGLDAAEDPVIGDYTVWIRGGEEGEEYLLTARAGGELMWAIGGVVPYWRDEQPIYTATITEYEENDCKTDTYGLCPHNTFSSDGTPPCTACPFGDVTTSSGATECVLGALAWLDLPQSVADAIVADAVSGFAGPGFVAFDDYSWRHVLVEKDANVLSLAGTFQRWDDIDATLPASIAIFAYLFKEDDPDAFLSSQGTINPSTGVFSVVLEDVPSGGSMLILSFVILDAADASKDMGTDTVFDYEVTNVGCGNALTLTLEWEPQSMVFEWDTGSSYDATYIDLWIIEPSGAEIPWDDSTIGFHSTSGAYPVIYTVYGDNPDAVGTYNIKVDIDWVPHGTEWKLTAEVRGEVLWIERGVFNGYIPTTNSGSYDWNYDDDITELELILDDASRYEC